MIFRGRYENESGIFRPYITVVVLSPANKWVEVDFLVDTGADETFLDFNFIKKFNIDTKGIDVRDDVGGVGGAGVPYFQIDSALKPISSDVGSMIRHEFKKEESSLGRILRPVADVVLED